MTPLRVFRTLAFAEAVTWALLLTGMAFKYSGVTEVGVQVSGLVHGTVFIAYSLVAVVVGIDQRWSPGRRVLALAAAVPPFATVWFERYAEARGLLGDEWLSRHDSPTVTERTVCWLLRHHRLTIPLGLLAVVGLTGAALRAGPPV